MVRLSALRTGHLHPEEIFPVLISVRGWVDPRGHSAIGRILSMKIPVTPGGIEPATFRSVAQHLNNWAAAVRQWCNIMIWKLYVMASEIIHSFFNSFIHPFFKWLIHPSIHSFIQQFIHYIIHSFTHSSIHSYINSFNLPFIYSSIH